MFMKCPRDYTWPRTISPVELANLPANSHLASTSFARESEKKPNFMDAKIGNIARFIEVQSLNHSH